MNWKCFTLSDDDARVKKHLLENIQMGAWKGNALSTRLAARVPAMAGSAIAIAFDEAKLEQVKAFRYAPPYGTGQSLHDYLKPYKPPRIQFPIAGMVDFLDQYLRNSEQATVICENWFGTRSKIATWPYENQSRMSYFGEEVYHILSHGDTDLDLIDSTIGESESKWGIGVCSSCKNAPQGEIRSEAFFDEIIANLAHLFVPAFDGEGHLIWSPSTVDG